jgi:RNA polymerase sigma-70 factor, ECF subfamily
VAVRQEELTSLCGDVDFDRDRALVERCQKGDSAAFGNLYARYYDRLLRFCLRRLNDRHEAEDAAQEAFARAWKALPNFAGERRFYPWLTVIAGNICTDMLRRRSRSTPTEDLELGTYQPVGVATQVTSDEVLLAAVDGDLVHQAMDRLSARHRHVLDMREGSGWTYQQIADHEGVQIGTIETLLWRARQALKREFTVLSESKGAFAGFLVGLGAAVKTGILRTGHRVAGLHPSGGSGTLRNAVAGAAVTSAAVAAAVIAPHAFSGAHPAGGQSSLTAPATTAVLASPPRTFAFPIGSTAVTEGLGSLPGSGTPSTEPVHAAVGQQAGSTSAVGGLLPIGAPLGTQLGGLPTASPPSSAVGLLTQAAAGLSGAAASSPVIGPITSTVSPITAAIVGAGTTAVTGLGSVLGLGQEGAPPATAANRSTATSSGAAASPSVRGTALGDGTRDHG